MNEFVEKYNYWYEENKKFFKVFSDKYPKDKISKLKIDEYVVGKKGQSFCWWVDNKLSSLGDIRGELTADQLYGIYYSHKNNNYVFLHKSRDIKSRFGNKGDKEETAFNNVISEMIKLEYEFIKKIKTLTSFIS